MDASTLIATAFNEVDDQTVIPRHHVLTHLGDIEDRLYYIHSGCVCAFRITAEEEQVVRFGYTDSIMNALPSFFMGRPAEMEIRAIRKSTISSISKDEFIALTRDPEFKDAYIELLEHFVGEMMEREFDLLTSSPLERIERVRKRSPQLFSEAPLKYIASYLRMTPETLSRILSKS